MDTSSNTAESQPFGLSTTTNSTHTSNDENRNPNANAVSKRAAFTGKWKLHKSQGYDAFLQAMGVAWIFRKLILAASPTQEVEQSADGLRFTFRIPTIRGDQIESFELGKEYEYIAMDGTQVKGVAQWEGEAVRSKLQTNKGAESVSRSLVDDLLLVEITYKGQSKPCRRYYRRMDPVSEHMDNYGEASTLQNEGYDYYSG